MPPLVIYLLTLFRFKAFRVWDPDYEYPSLSSVRRFAKQYGGVVWSRPHPETGKRYELEHWRDGQMVWRNPDYDKILKVSQDHLEYAAKYWDLAAYWVDPGDKMP